MNTRKFTSLAIGERFSYRGTGYVKISPLLARSEPDGASRMIPRAALVDALDTLVAATRSPPADPAHAALADYHQAVLACLEDLASSASPQSIAAARSELSTAHERALARLTLRRTR